MTCFDFFADYHYNYKFPWQFSHCETHWHSFIHLFKSLQSLRCIRTIMPLFLTYFLFSHFYGYILVILQFLNQPVFSIQLIEPIGIFFITDMCKWLKSSQPKDMRSNASVEYFFTTEEKFFHFFVAEAKSEANFEYLRDRMEQK